MAGSQCASRGFLRHTQSVGARFGSSMRTTKEPGVAASRPCADIARGDGSPRNALKPKRRITRWFQGYGPRTDGAKSAGLHEAVHDLGRNVRTAMITCFLARRFRSANDRADFFCPFVMLILVRRDEQKWRDQRWDSATLAAGFSQTSFGNNPCGTES